MKLELAICTICNSNHMRQSPIQSNGQNCMWPHTYLPHILFSFFPFDFITWGGVGILRGPHIYSHPCGCWLFHPHNLCTRESLSCFNWYKQGQSSSIDPTYLLTYSLPPMTMPRISVLGLQTT